jgi:hypothetical protein
MNRNRMRWQGLMMGAVLAAWPLAARTQEDPVAVDMARRVKTYFDQRFADLKAVAERQPTVETFRAAMKPVVENTEGFFGGTLIDPEFVIREVYFKRDFLARGYDLKKVPQLVDFAKKMKAQPAPQLSEPAHGNVMQPRLVAMRYPVLKDGKLVQVVSIMVRTEAFLKATGLDKAKAFRIVCLGKLAEEHGTLSATPHKTTLDLPSTRWEILFDEAK